MDSYIVHIYRQREEDPEELAGIVEIVGRGEKKPFLSFDELRKILILHSTGKKREKTGRGK